MNNKVKEYVNERTKRLFSLNRIRFYKMIEIVQLSITTFIITVIAAKFFNKIFMGRKTSEEKEKELRKKSLLDLSISLCLELIIYCIVFFYIKKLVMIIPPLPLFLDSNFIPHHTVEYVMHMVFLLLLRKLTLLGFSHRRSIRSLQSVAPAGKNR